MTYCRTITEQLLETWVNQESRRAQELIVELVDRLIQASTNKELTYRHFSKNIQDKGADGELITTSSNNQYIPIGNSFWEIGTNNNPNNKFKKDINTYSDIRRLNGKNKSESTFVFVTPRCGAKDKIQQMINDDDGLTEEKNKWKSIQILDATHICDWISECPTVSIWFNGKIGRPIDNIQIIDNIWDEIERVTYPHSLTPDVFLVNRNSEKEGINNFLNSNDSFLKIYTFHPQNIPDVIAAVIKQRDDYNIWCNKILVIGSDIAFQKIVNESESHLLVLTYHVNNIEKEVYKANLRGHRVIYSDTPNHKKNSDDNTVTLTDIPDEYIQNELSNIGYNYNQACCLSHNCFGNPSNLRKLISGLQVYPNWELKDTNVSIVKLICLIGEWDEKYDGDIKFIEDLTSEPYENFIHDIDNISIRIPEFPIILDNSIRKVTHKNEIWDVIWKQISERDIISFCKKSESILLEIDPKYNLTPDKRVYASLNNEKLKYSNRLRYSIADTLAFLASPFCHRNTDLEINYKNILRNTIHNVLSEPNWKRYATLERDLHLLAEAAPEEFLKILRKNINSDLIGNLIQKTPTVFGQEGPYIDGLIYSLETLAWSNEHFLQSIEILNKIAQLEGEPYGDKVAYNAIQTILLASHASTTAVRDKCRTALVKLYSDNQQLFEQLILSETSYMNNSCVSISKPYWRSDFFNKFETPYNLHSIYSELVINGLKDNIKLFILLFSKYPSRYLYVRKTLLDYLGNINLESLSQNERKELLSSLIDAEFFVLQHPSLKNNSQVESETLSQIILKFSKSEPMLKYISLFNPIKNIYLYSPDLLSSDDERYRFVEAINDIYSQGGIKKILEFASLTQVPETIGYLFGTISSCDNDDKELLPKYLSSDEKYNSFIFGYINGKFSKKSWGWVNNISLESWNIHDRNKFLLSLPQSNETWEYVSKLLGSDEDMYWCRVNPYIQSSLNWKYYLNKLHKYNHPLAMINCISSLLNQKVTVDVDYVYSSLELYLSHQTTLNNMDQYDISQLIKYLEESKDIDRNKVALLEIIYINIISENIDKKNLTCYQKLASEPDFFCEILGYLYKSDCKSEQNQIHNSDARIHNAFYLLYNWTKIPGLNDDGSFDECRFFEWYKSVLCIADKLGLKTPALIEIGKILIYAPKDPSDLWIHKSIANLLNDDENDQLRNYFEIALRNMDGAHISNGKWEEARELDCRDKAEALDSAGYPVFAGLMREIAESYLNDKNRTLSEIRTYI